jgi:hypothetical protein
MADTDMNGDELDDYADYQGLVVKEILARERKHLTDEFGRDHGEIVETELTDHNDGEGCAEYTVWVKLQPEDQSGHRHP